MHRCDCGCVLVASDDPEPMGHRLIHFIRPLLLEYLDLELDPGEYKEIFKLSTFLWNLASPEQIPEAIRTLESGMQPRLRFPAPKARAMIRELLARRRSPEFAKDHRLALRLKVTYRAGRISISAVGVRFEPGPAHGAQEQDPLPLREGPVGTRRLLH